MKVKFLAMGMVATSMASLASADMVFVDFENYPDGKIANGYDGWQITANKWDQQVVSSGAINGGKSWLISDKVTSGSYGDQPYSPALNDKVGETQSMNLFTASMLFKPLSGGVEGEGTTISIDNGTGQRGNYIRIANTGNDLWKVFVYDFNSTLDDFVYTELASGISAGSVHSLSFSMLFNPGANNDVWKVSLDGNELFTGVGWENYFRNYAPTYGPTPVVYDRLLFRCGGGSAYPNAAGILFDDIRYSSSVAGSAVPSPAAVLPFGLGLLAAYRRRTRR